ncbi:HAD-IA family hydrolase [Thiospirillum jenense]|uniref:HAD-IA family hydrolase n=2 Tax=Thiospirillum jenense TaxID=1653858 RepID=A0A839HKF0_9GAMM|nr:HAD-IA family hydrolase [Thiospirillum jenense]
MSALKALIFDVDGTLAETERDGHRIAFNRAFTAAGDDCQWSPDEYGALLEITGGKERLTHYFNHLAPAAIATRWAQLSPAAQVELVATLHRQKTTYYTELLATGAIALRPGVLRLLKEARAAGLQLAIATTTTLDNVTALFTHAGLADLIEWFTVIAAGDVVANKKPAPDIFTFAMQHLHCTPAQCVVIEDSLPGLQAAMAAEIKTVLITLSYYTRNQDFTGAALVVDQLGEPTLPVTIVGGDCADFIHHALGCDDASLPNYIDLTVLQQLHQQCWQPQS